MTSPARTGWPERPHRSNLLKQSEVQVLLAIRVVSQLGTSIHFVAQAWFIYQLTRSGTILGLTSVMSLLGPVLLGGIGGHPTDRFSARRVLLCTQAALGAIAGVEGVLVHLNAIGAAGLVVCTGALSVVATFAVPAWQVLLAEMSGKDELARLTALNTSAMDVGLVAGSALAAPVIAVMGVGGAFVLNAGSYALVVGVLSRPGHQHRPEPQTLPAPATTSRSGLTTVLRKRGVPSMMTLAMALSGAGASLPPLLLIVTADAGTAGRYGLYLALLSVGSIAGTALTWRARLSRYAVFSYSAAFGLLLTGLGLVSSTWLTGALLLPIGALALMLRASITTFVQLQTPAGLRGRVMSALQAALAASQIITTVSLTSLSDAAGAAIAITVSGTGVLLCTCALIVITVRRTPGTGSNS
ncbi:MFS transporter [Kineosporia sp. J2-2]|uniref:MFS transporter n=1 Tax=Kineosporia corallincola TaxID=2835133 RepID=A0ABS5TBZ8_9ACTN|nr:MFS transporter [Kineosporia corallincola]MBT0768604.1 MFS transporter [Kineosporia corallincola]